MNKGSNLELNTSLIIYNQFINEWIKGISSEACLFISSRVNPICLFFLPTYNIFLIILSSIFPYSDELVVFFNSLYRHDWQYFNNIYGYGFADDLVGFTVTSNGLDLLLVLRAVLRKLDDGKLLEIYSSLLEDVYRLSS